MKKVRLVGTGLLVCLVLVVVPAMAMTTEVPEGWRPYELQWGDTLSELAWKSLIGAGIHNPVDRIGDVVEIIQAENAIVDADVIYAWAEITIPTPEILPDLLVKKRVPTGQELQIKVSRLEGILGDQSVALEQAALEIEQLQKERKEFQRRISELDYAKLFYRRLFLLALLILLVFGVISVAVIRNEIRYRKKRLEEAEEENKKLQKTLETIENERDELKERKDVLQRSIPGEFVKVKAKKGDTEVEKDCKIITVTLEKGMLRRRLECPYCQTPVWEDNMAGHWIKSCKEGPFPKSKK